MEKKYLKLFVDCLEKYRKLNDAEFGRLIRAALSYTATGVEVELMGREELLWDGMKLDIDRADVYKRQDKFRLDISSFHFIKTGVFSRSIRRSPSGSMTALFNVRLDLSHVVSRTSCFFRAMYSSNSSRIVMRQTLFCSWCSCRNRASSSLASAIP